jgi:hypothetical protein
MTRSLVLTLAALAALARPAAAQVYGGLALSVATPQNEFRDELGATGYGAALNVLYHLGGHLGGLPLAVGVEGAAVTYGHARRRVPFRDDVPEVGLDVTTDNNVAQVLAVVRLQPARGLVRPYAEVVGGVNYLFTQSALRSTDHGESFAQTTNYDDVAPTGGVGLGAMVRLHRRAGLDGPKPLRGGGAREVLLDARVRYLVGGEASYLGRGDLRGEDGEVVVEPRRSRTDLLVPQVGVTVRF